MKSCNNILKSIGLRKAQLVFTLMIVFTNSYAQQNGEQVSRVQRAIYVYNLAQQVSWPEDTADTFRIGVLGPDRVILDFTAIAQQRQIKSRQVEVVKFLSVGEIDDVNILYVNKKYNYEMPYILKSVAGKGILIISEDYTFNASMINIIRVGNTFRHQINEEVLRDNRFTIAPSLKSFAIKSSQKWMSLFKEAQDSLKVTKQQVRKQDSLITIQEKEIISQSELIDTIQNIVKDKNSDIKELLAIDEIRKKTIQEKQVIAQDLENKIENQLTELYRQDTILKQRAEEIKLRQDSIESQSASIKAQEKALKKQGYELAFRENINWFLTGFAALLIVAGFVVYKNYRAKNRLSKELARTNLQITAQAEELSQKNKDLEQFAYIASHDLQEPLNTISSFIGLIKNDYKDKFDDVGRQSLDFIQEASHRMKKLIDVLLEYSSLGKDRVFKSVDLLSVMQELEKDLSTLISRKNATIEYKKLPEVLGSEVELRLLFQNLITNALKFCPEDRLPVLTIDAIKTTSREHQNQEVWQFSFADNGIGIRKDHQERIFSIFQRLHSTDEYEGTGIGLAHCKKIVAIHKGEIWLESEFGKGSTFYFTIPS